VPSVVAALRDPSQNICWEAITALGNLRDQRATRPLLELLAEDPTGLCSWRVDIIESLGRIGDPQAGDALSSLLDDPDMDVRKSVTAALGAIGWRPPDRAAAARRLVAECRWEELSGLDWEVASGPLLGTLKAGDYKSRLAAVTGLARFEASHALRPLVEALMDADQEVAAAAAEGLAQMGEAEAIGPLIDRCARYAPTGGYRNDPNAPYGEQARAHDWLKPLEALVKSAASEITTDDLHRLAGLQDITFNLRVDYDTPGYGDGADDFTVTLNYLQLRDLAKDILRRRRLPE
jgi:HEAT repeat protein